MTPKEKAKQLVDKFSIIGLQQRNEGIQCALIAVDEIMKCTKYEQEKFTDDRFSEKYWQEVKQEIEKL